MDEDQTKERQEEKEIKEEVAELVNDRKEPSAEEQERQSQEAVETENRASIYGWVPKEEFRGDKTKWVPADVFIKRAEEILPIAKSMNRKLESDLIAANRKIEQMDKTVRAVIQAHKKVAQGTYESRLAQIKTEQRKAVETGDTATWDFLEVEKERIQKPEDIPIHQTKEENPVVVQWKLDNAWYESDPELGTYADTVSNYITARRPGLPPDEFLKAVKEEVQRRFPDKFANPNRRRTPSVDRSETGGNGGDSGKKKTYSDLPADAKIACDDLVKQKILTRERYLKTYFEEA